MKSDQDDNSLIEKLRAAKEMKGLSYQAISDKTAEIGMYVSVSSVVRALTHGSKTSNCRRSTLFSIAQVLGVQIGAADEQLMVENEMLTIKVDAMQAQIADKDAQIASMRDTVQKLMANVSHKDRRILLLTVALCVLLFAAAVLLGFDILQPNVGFILGH